MTANKKARRNMAVVTGLFISQGNYVLRSLSLCLPIQVERELTSGEKISFEYLITAS